MTDLDTLTPAAAAESQKLQRHFGRFDILFFLICTIVGVDTIATVAQGGGEAFTWMMIFAVVFFVPQALLFSELGAAFPQEGGPYLWTRLAFGRKVAAVNAVGTSPQSTQAFAMPQLVQAAVPAAPAGLANTPAVAAERAASGSISPSAARSRSAAARSAAARPARPVRQAARRGRPVTAS